MHQPPETESDHNPVYNDVVEVFSDVFGKLMSYATTDWINVEISTAQIKVIFVLHFGGPHSLNQLAGRLNVGQPTASHLVEKLVQAGYASRVEAPTDRRAIEVHLTEAGHAMADRLSGVTHKGIIAQWVSQLSNDQQAALGDSLHALLTIIETHPE